MWLLYSVSPIARLDFHQNFQQLPRYKLLVLLHSWVYSPRAQLPLFYVGQTSHLTSPDSRWWERETISWWGGTRLYWTRASGLGDAATIVFGHGTCHIWHRICEVLDQLLKYAKGYSGSCIILQKKDTKSLTWRCLLPQGNGKKILPHYVVRR